MAIITTRSRSRSDQKGTYMQVLRYANTALPFWEAKQLYASGGVIGKASTIRDSNNPGYRRRRSKGELVFSDMNLVVQHRSFSSMNFGFAGGPTSDGYRCAWSGDGAAMVERMNFGPRAIDLYIGDLGPEALISALAKVNADSINSGEIMSSLTKTVQMLRRPFSSARHLLQKCYKDASKSYKKTALSVTKANASAWLEYRYGFKPLLMDAAKTVDLAASFQKRLGGSRVVVRASVAKDRNSVTEFTDKVVYGQPWRVSGRIESTRKLVANAGIIVEVAKATSGQQVARDYQLGMNSVVPLLWEIMPYSFVVDWFVGVGPWLNAMNLPPGVTIAGTWVTYVDKMVTKHVSTNLKEYVPSLGTDATGSWGASFHTMDSITRECNKGLPSSPVINLDFRSITHAVDALALLTTPVLGLLNKMKH